MARSAHSFKLKKSQHYFSVFFLFLALIIIALIVLGATSQIPFDAILAGLGLSLYRLAIAYIISLILAVALAVLVINARLSDALIPVFDLMQNLPSFALIPLFIYVFGYTNKMAIIFAASSILWPILFYTIHALSTARLELNEAAAIFGAKGLKRVIYYSIPMSFPALVTGSIVGVSIGWEAVIGVEIIGLSSGIGVFLNSAISANRAVFSAGLVVLLLSVLIINRLIWMPLLKRANLYGE